MRTNDKVPPGRQYGIAWIITFYSSIKWKIISLSFFSCTFYIVFRKFSLAMVLTGFTKKALDLARTINPSVQF